MMAETITICPMERMVSIPPGIFCSHPNSELLDLLLCRDRQSTVFRPKMVVEEKA